MIDVSQKPLAGKKGLVLGIANEHSIAFGCAQAFHALGAELAITYANEKSKTYSRSTPSPLRQRRIYRAD
jgi:enoyl-[acyl-carrier protein] reductase I